MTPSHASTDEGSSTFLEVNRDIEAVQTTIAAALAKFSYSEAARFAIRLSIEEAVMNGFHHGNQSDPKKQVEVRWRIDQECASFHVIDQGEGFDPTAVPDPTLDENLEIPSGRGIMLIRAYMTDARFHGAGNHLEMNYRKGAQQ